MAIRRRNVVPFSRDYRRPPRWRMGPRGTRPPRRQRSLLETVLRVAILSVLVIGLGSFAVDAANGLIKPTDGCRILTVTDGDTVSMHCPKIGFTTARLVGFDTPEYRARCSRELAMAVGATFALRWFLWSTWDIRVETLRRDRYGRMLAVVHVDGVLLRDRMVATGLARAYAGGPRSGWCGTGSGTS